MDTQPSSIDKPIDLSIVIPSYNEEKNIVALLDRLLPVLDDLGLTSEVIFVDDGSRDSTYTVLQAAHLKDRRVKAVTLSRNFGKEIALTAGLHFACGRAVIPMDADLQHPPETIRALVAGWQAGADVVVAVRRTRDTDSALRKLASRAFFLVFNSLSETSIVDGGGDFRLFDRRVVDVLNRLPERTRFLKGLYSWVGFRQVTVPYDVDARFAGKTTFGFFRLCRYAIDALISFSILPLRVWSALGATLIGIAVIYAAIVAVDVILYGRNAPGFASLLIVVVLFGGIQFLTLGIIGEYIGRILVEVKGRPIFIVRDTVGIPQPKN